MLFKWNAILFWYSSNIGHSVHYCITVWRNCRCASSYLVYFLCATILLLKWMFVSYALLCLHLILFIVSLQLSTKTWSILVPYFMNLAAICAHLCGQWDKNQINSTKHFEKLGYGVWRWHNLAVATKCVTRCVVFNWFNFSSFWNCRFFVRRFKWLWCDWWCTPILDASFIQSKNTIAHHFDAMLHHIGPKLNLWMGSWSSCASQIFWNRCRSTQFKSWLLLCPCRLADDA